MVKPKNNFSAFQLCVSWIFHFVKNDLIASLPSSQPSFILKYSSIAPQSRLGNPCGRIYQATTTITTKITIKPCVWAYTVYSMSKIKKRPSLSFISCLVWGCPFLPLWTGLESMCHFIHTMPYIFMSLPILAYTCPLILLDPDGNPIERGRGAELCLQSLAHCDSYFFASWAPPNLLFAFSRLFVWQQQKENGGRDSSLLDFAADADRTIANL
jgi:hypothetical protein